MGKNKGKGGKNRRRGKNETIVKRELVEKEEGQEYAQVVRMLGNGRLDAYCFDGKKRLCHIRGKMRKKVWVNQGDIVLIGLRPYQDEKGDVILRYNADESRALKRRGELPSNIQIEDHPELDADQDVPFEFTNDVDYSSDEDDHRLSSEQRNRGMMPPSDSESEEEATLE